MAGSSRSPLGTRGWRPYRYGRRGPYPELKYNDVTQSNQLITNTGIVAVLNAIATGTDVNGRVGRQITIKSILVNFNIYNNDGANSSVPDGVYGRISLVYDSQPNGGGAAAMNAIWNSADPNAPVNLNNRDRFKILWTRRYQISAYFLNGSAQITGGAPQNKYFSIFKKCNLPVVYGGAGGTAADIQTGTLLLTITADSTNNSAWAWNSRIRYVDN